LKVESGVRRKKGTVHGRGSVLTRDLLMFEMFSCRARRGMWTGEGSRDMKEPQLKLQKKLSTM